MMGKNKDQGIFKEPFKTIIMNSREGAGFIPVPGCNGLKDLQPQKGHENGRSGMHPQGM